MRYKHRDLRGRRARFDEPLDRLRHRGGFGSLVGIFVECRLRTGVALADQVQLAAGHPSARRGDDPVGQRDHLRRRPVVAFQAHHSGVRKPPREVQQVARCGAGERVDGLVGVADDGQVVAVAQPRRQHPLLQRRHVLVLVDDEAAVAVPELVGDRGVVLDRCRGMQQQVVEVEHGDTVTAGLERLVGRVHRRHLRGVQRDIAGDRRRPPRDTAPGEINDALAHSISPATSRTSSVLSCRPARLAPRATTANLVSSSCQPVSPTTRGQKYRSCRCAAA